MCGWRRIGSRRADAQQYTIGGAVGTDDSETLKALEQAISNMA
jgi:hypothetical protein